MSKDADRALLEEHTRLLHELRDKIDQLSGAEPSDLFTRDDPTLIYANKGLLRENAQLRRDLDLKVKELTEDGEEIERLRGDLKVSREAYVHMVASHNELSDLTIKEFGSSVAEESCTEAAIRLLREQKTIINRQYKELQVKDEQIAELEQELTQRSPDQRGAADSVVIGLTDLATAVAAGIRAAEKMRK